ncbi:Stk1 family PASTA domain-containing Ser/Thr kinase [Caldicellulosiruptoraceae bacterium PP1]
MQDIVLGNRYEIIEKIGGGGMSVVYKAKDKMLNRFVAIKVLRSEYVNDEEFIKRFKSESLAAASLSHPNIVSIFDVGEDKGFHYIVMEFINGKTLKEVIKENGRLSYKDAIAISIQICRALEHAHKKGIIHRDIKPQNIMIDENGIVRVTDFGIARAVTTGTIINTNITIGSVHYFSPEQARGGFVDAKSDIYSLGVVLYEMTTGNLPFEGETPISVALKHIQEEPVKPSLYNKDIPKSLEDIILKALKKDQTQRYQSIVEIMQDLKNSLLYPDGDFVKINTENTETKQYQAIDTNNINKDNKKTLENNTNSKKKNVKYALLGIGSALVLVLMIWLVFYMTIGKQLFVKEEEIILPNLVGLTIDEAKLKLEDLGLTYKITETNDKADKGIVIKQDPEADIHVKKNATINLTVSLGPEVVEVPDLSGMNVKDAEVELTNVGLNIQTKKDFSDKPVDTVISQDPAPHESIEKNGTVTVTISQGPKIEKVTVPDVTGMKYYDAKDILERSGINIGNIEYKEVTDKDDDIVLYQSIKSGTEINKGDSINLTLAKKIQQPTNSTKIFVKNIILPSDLQEANVKIVVVTDNNESVVFDRTVTVDETPLQVKIPISGKSTIRLYINDSLNSEETVEN